jgi:hypothetical protein
MLMILTAGIARDDKDQRVHDADDTFRKPPRDNCDTISGSPYCRYEIRHVRGHMYAGQGLLFVQLPRFEER